ncbi:MAG: vanadium-dependent haloperoxidase [Acidobacteriota bacterium]
MKNFKNFLILLFVFALTYSGLTLKVNAQKSEKLTSGNTEKNATLPTKSAAYDWLDIALEATAREHDRNAPRPTIGSRMLMIITTSMYDAWAAYDEKAVGTRLGGTLRRPKVERTEANKRTAISYATYRAMLDLFADDKEWLDDQMRKNGYDPSNNTTDITTPEGIGNVAAAALIEYRHHDGANQLGDEEGSNGKPYSDYTFYRPINPQNNIIDPDCWQPIEFTLTEGKKATPGFLTPQWYRVKSFGLEHNDMFRPGPPPKVGSEELKKEVDEVIMYNSSLTLEQKAVVEFMRDGPRSTGQSGHWLRLAQAVSLRDKNNTDTDVKMYFAVGVATSDAFIASWEAKRYYDSSRPWTLIRYYYKDKQIRGWSGVGKGVSTIPAEEWHPYSPISFITPPFPGYVSGHSTVSAAGAKILELFTGSDAFGATAERHPGEMTEAGVSCELKQSVDGKPGAKITGDGTVTLKMPTFTAAAEMAGLSRVMGGYHIQADNIAGLELGRKVAAHIYPKIESYFNGTSGKSNDTKMTAAR